MLRLVYFIFVVLVSVSALDGEKMKVIHETCMKDFEITAEIVGEAKKNKDYSSIDPCFIACLFKGDGMIDDKGMFDVEKINAIAEKLTKNPDEYKKVKNIGEKCSLVNDAKVSDGEKGCERAKLLAQCLKESTGDVF